MLYELVELGQKLQERVKFPPISYKPKHVQWIIDLSSEQPRLLGPYKRGEFRIVEAPDRQRSGKVSQENLKPYLLMDDARYVLGIPENPSKSDEAALMHQGFVQLIREAYEKTGLKDLEKILDFYRRPIPEEFRQKIKGKDLVTFQTEPEIFPFEKVEIQRFWAAHLSENLLSEEKAECSICGSHQPYVKYIPNPLVVFGQTCQLTSFNEDAFKSRGKEQTHNAPICFSCATSTVDTLNYLLRDSRHHAVLVYQDRDLLRSQIAVFWLNTQQEELQWNGLVIDQQLLASPLLTIFDEETKRRLPPPELEQLQDLIRLPKTGREQALKLDEASFHMGILSPNKARLVIREWIHSSVSGLLDHLKTYLDALRIVQPSGESGKIQPLPVLLQAIETVDAHLVRQLLRTIYQGYAPPHQLLPMVLQRFRLPHILTDRKESWKYAALASLIKLALTYGKEEAISMEALNPTYLKPAYLCGRLLAVLEEIQQRATGFKIGSTVVQRYYGAASTAPASTFGSLLRLTTTAHLPKVSPDMARLLEEVMQLLDQAGGFPTTLSMKEQAEFGLGFYHQRAQFNNQRHNK